MDVLKSKDVKIQLKKKHYNAKIDNNKKFTWGDRWSLLLFSHLGLIMEAVLYILFDYMYAQANQKMDLSFLKKRKRNKKGSISSFFFTNMG